MRFVNNNFFRLVLDVFQGLCEEKSKIISYQYSGFLNQRFYINADKTITPACNVNLQVSWTSYPYQIVLTYKMSELYKFTISQINSFIPPKNRSIAAFASGKH